MSLLTHVVDWLVPFICGGVATVLGLMWRWGKAMVNGLRELLLCQLEDLRREMVIEHDGVADEDLKSRSQRLYDSYHSLGGNGHGTSLNNDIQSAPIAPRQSWPTTVGHKQYPSRERGNMVNNLKRHPKPSLPDELRPDVAPETIIESNKEEQ